MRSEIRKTVIQALEIARVSLDTGRNGDTNTDRDPVGYVLQTARHAALEDWIDVPKDDPPNAVVDVIDLFSGCGGLSAGFRLYSQIVPVYRLAGALDIDEDACRTYRVNLGLEPLRIDASEVANRDTAWERFVSSLSRRDGNMTVVLGGPPCQGFSSHRKSIAGCERLNSLFEHFATIAVRLGPDVILMENVPELVSERSWQYYSRAAAILHGAGYLVRTRIYNLAGFGLPQERFRLITLAMRNPFSMPQPFLTRDQYRTVRQAIGGLAPVRPGEPDPSDPMHVTARHAPSTIATIAAVPKDGGRRPPEVGPECLRRLAQRNGRTGYDDVYGRLWWDRPAVTITGHSRNPASGRFSHPEQNRGLSVREAAMLQGFPRRYTFEGTRTSQFLQVGNAVPPSFSAYMAGHILAQLLAEDREIHDDVGQDIVRPIGRSFSRLIASIKRECLAG